ncbi:hypothetical protein CDD81_727 [Ophiocordyceps australis]|uniref:Sodium/calcium exchanger membrane region domain-containing protein n=1 Tax=Ophiocordyceps australis TaxID=1399860 RepID=A0A2C5X8F6_9HYPO|nr:hypothetical protein CDD81_727 [Ophiocordyceps australis]
MEEHHDEINHQDGVPVFRDCHDDESCQNYPPYQDHVDNDGASMLSAPSLPQSPSLLNHGVTRVWKSWHSIRRHVLPHNSLQWHRLDCNQQARGSFVGPLRDMVCSSWLNLLLVFVPVGFASHLLDASPLFVFASNALAIIPLSVLLTDATEAIAAYAGDTVGALLNISLGNLVELILFMCASILGSVLVNLLLILGSALLVSSGASCEPTYNSTEAQLLACLLFVSVFAFLMPTAFSYTYLQRPSANSSLMLSRISSLLILAIYIVYLIHELRWHSRHHGHNKSLDHDVESHMSVDDEHLLRLPPLSISVSQPLPPRTIRFADQDNFGPALCNAGNNKTNGVPHIGASCFDSSANDDFEPRGRNCTDVDPEGWHSHQRPLRPRKHARSLSLGSREAHMDGDLRRVCSRSSLTTLHLLHDGRLGADQDVSRPQAASHVAVALALLGVSSALMSLCAQLLVDTIDDVTRQTRLSEALIGLIVLPIVGNVAEYVTVVAVAARDKLDLAIAVAVGSSIQIALCVTPLTVIAGWLMQRHLSLTFNFFEMATLMGGVLLVNLLVLTESGGGLRMSALKGALMCACYVIVGLGAYFAPEEM